MLKIINVTPNHKTTCRPKQNVGLLFFSRHFDAIEVNDYGLSTSSTNNFFYFETNDSSCTRKTLKKALFYHGFPDVKLGHHLICAT